MIVIDTDFLSSFAKIGELKFIFSVFNTREIVITESVYHELKESPVFDLLSEYFLAKENKITVKNASRIDVLENLGAGERESISLAKENEAKLLMSDKVAGRYAEKEGVKVIDIPAFLFHVKEKRILDSSQLETVIEKLKQKDFYKFEKEVEKTLISDANNF